MCCSQEPCPNTRSCLLYEGGQCKSTCARNERVTPGICNLGTNCKCCAKQCTPLKSCTDINGFCVQDRKDCVNGFINVGDCEGYGCMCCSHEPCPNTGSCLLYEGGQCKLTCARNERVTPGICNLGKNCKCCAKQCTPLKSCTDINGFCVQDRKDCVNGFINVGDCQGYGCMCCSQEPCPNTGSCLLYEGGQCKLTCARNERVTPGICNLGKNCNFCAKQCTPLKSCTEKQWLLCSSPGKDCF
nr:delta-like protein C [Cherax quadricarinatus]